MRATTALALTIAVTFTGTFMFTGTVAGIAAAPCAAAAPGDSAADRAALLDDITVLDRPGVPGNLIVFGDDAFAVVTGGKRPEPVVAAARAGRGRVVAMAHSGFLDAAALGRAGDSRGRLVRNAVAWLAPRAKPVHVGIIGRAPGLVTALRAAGHDAWDGADPAAKRRADVYVWKNGVDREGLADDVVAFVERGGGLLTAACPWGWAQVRSRTEPGTTVRDDVTRVATPWGGPLYVEALRSARDAAEITFDGAVRAPRYVLGDDESAARWKQSRAAPGPWAELEGQNIVLSVPSRVIRELSDPAPILEFWDAVLAGHCELAGTPLPARRERFVPDVQISAGYMHAGYPIMTWMDVVTPRKGRALPPILDVEDRRENGAWGYFHELGHNRQRPWWNFRGTTEVTCNLFSLYTHEKLFGIVPWEHPWLEKQKKKAQPYLAKGAPFAEWRRKPGLALIAYAQIQRAFGWEPYRRVFADMEALDAAQRPTGDQDKLDEFVRHLSLAAGRDLRPFWRRWGAPLGKGLMDDADLAELPAWQPDWDDLP